MKRTLDDLIIDALDEDLPKGDLTTDSLDLADRKGRARVIAKEDLVVSGTVPFQKVFHRIDPDVTIEFVVKDGGFALRGQTICTLKGPYASLLKGERVALNFLGHLSGIATLTKCFAAETDGTRTKILDTRKTTPLWRSLERAAVVHGGGVNHRLNLSDKVLIKENHIQAAGGIRNAVTSVRKHGYSPIEIEVRNLDEVKAAVDSRVDIILLDNMDNASIAEALKLIPSSIKTEASGNMTLERIRSVAELGVDFISVGAITHSAPTADLSMLIEETKPS